MFKDKWWKRAVCQLQVLTTILEINWLIPMLEKYDEYVNEIPAERWRWHPTCV